MGDVRHRPRAPDGSSSLPHDALDDEAAALGLELAGEECLGDGGEVVGLLALLGEAFPLDLDCGSTPFAISASQCRALVRASARPIAPTSAIARLVGLRLPGKRLSST